jgi:hypothetical protein
MQVSRPHCELELQVLGLEGVRRQAPARQYSPTWQSALDLQPSSHTPWTQLCPEVQSAVVAQLGRVSQLPEWQPHDEWQSDVWLQAQPGQPWLQ